MSEPNTPTSSQGDPELGDAGKKALVAERARADEAEKKLKAVEARATELEAEVQTATDKAQAVATEAAAETARLQDELGKSEVTITKLTIGIDEKLPMSLINRMQGDDEDSLRADAKELAGFVSDETPSPFPKADPSQGVKGTPVGGTTADQFATFMESKLT